MENLEPGIKAHIERHDAYIEIADQIIGKYHAAGMLCSGRRGYLSAETLSVVGDNVDISWEVCWSGGDRERGTLRVSADWFDNPDPEKVNEDVSRLQAHKEAEAAEFKARKEAVEKQRQLESAMATVQAAGFELHLPKKD